MVEVDVHSGHYRILQDPDEHERRVDYSDAGQLIANNVSSYKIPGPSDVLTSLSTGTSSSSITTRTIPAYKTCPDCSSGNSGNSTRSRQTWPNRIRFEMLPFNRVLFWDCYLESLDLENHRLFIIGRVLTRGQLSDWQALTRLCSKRSLAADVVRIRDLDPRTLKATKETGAETRMFPGH